MRAGRPPEALTSYLACIDQPAFLVNRTYTREIRHWQDGRIVWQNEATAEGTELEPQDLDTVNKLLDGLGQKQDTVRSTRLERWEATWAASDSELAVLRKLPLPASPLIFEPPLQSPALSRNNSASSSKPQNLSNIAKAAGPSALALSPVSSPAAMLSKLAETDEAARVIFHHRWEDTTLGPMSQWDPCIASAVYSLLTYPWPCCLCIGPSHLMLYNTHYIRILGSKHPDCLGQRAQDVWPELYDFIGPLCKQVMETGIGVFRSDSQLFLQNSTDSKRFSEMRVSWSYVPFLNSEGKTAGFFNPVADKTKLSLDERRSRALRQLRAAIGSARQQDHVYLRAVSALREFRQDIPFLAIFAVEPENAKEEDAKRPYTGTVNLTLKEMMGIKDKSLIPRQCRITLGQQGASDPATPWPFAAAFDDDFVHVDLPQEWQNPEKFNNPGWPDDVVREAGIACSSQAHGLPRVLIIAGINTRHPLDEENRQFITSVSRFIDTGIMAALDSESERLQMQTLERLVALRTEELANSQARYKSLCDFSPSGVCECTQDGQITYVNEAWRRMTTISDPLPLPADCFLASVGSGSLNDVRSQWEKSYKERKATQLQWQWKHGGYVYSETFPLPSGQSMSVWTDISAHLAYSDKLVDRQRARAEEAEGNQKIQENFISLIQHETRNPVNAILQGTDVILSCLQNLELLHTRMEREAKRDYKDFKKISEALAFVSRMAASCIADIQEVNETVEAIAIAARHQAKIAADLLSQSKMQQGLLTLAPVDFVLLSEVSNIVKLFSAQARLAQVTMNVKPTSNVNELTVVRADPTRFTQIIVNLVSNSMRFLECWHGERRLDLHFDLCRERPKLQTKTVSDPSKASPPPQEHRLYLLCKVHDTGPGLTTEQQSRLFTRFNDASHNSEANRLRGGGTGLGLYLSRQLAKLQGGEISAESQLGQGSTFSFYIETEMGRRDRLEAEQDVRLLDSKPAMLNVSPQPWPPVLIVEDNSISQKLMRRQLENRGFRVRTASNGFDALKIMCSDDLLLAGLLDVEMPVKDGIETSLEYREFEKREKRQRKLPLCAVTGNASDAQVQRIKSAGIDFVLSKPYQIGDLIDFLQNSGSSLSSKDL